MLAGIGRGYPENPLFTMEDAMTTAVSPLLGRPLWYELMTTDMPAAEAFYKTVVGWTSTPFAESPQPYTMFSRAGDKSRWPA